MAPGFLIGFAPLVALNSIGVIPAALSAAATEGSRALLVVAIAAVRVKTAFGDVFKVGLRASVLILAETAVLLGFKLASVQALWRKKRACAPRARRAQRKPTEPPPLRWA